MYIPGHFAFPEGATAELHDLIEARPFGILVAGAPGEGVEGPEAALALLDGLDSDWHYLWVARSDLQRRLGRPEEASMSLHRALASEMNDSDRALLEGRLAELKG